MATDYLKYCKNTTTLVVDLLVCRPYTTHTVKEQQMNNYEVLYSTFRKQYALDYMAKHTNLNLLLWLTGSGEWQVRAYFYQEVGQ